MRFEMKLLAFAARRHLKRKAKAKQGWREWFAWFPVIIGESPDGSPIYAFLERVHRRFTYREPGYHGERGRWAMAETRWEYRAYAAIAKIHRANKKRSKMPT